MAKMGIEGDTIWKFLVYLVSASPRPKLMQKNCTTPKAFGGSP